MTVNPNDVTLGCPEEYSAFVVARDLQTYAANLPWSSISWSRILDDISTASVIVPDVFGGLRCNLELGDAIRPWRFGIRIERNGQEVWTGPITAMERPAGSDYVEISCHDAMIWPARRTVTQDLSYTDADAGAVFQGVLADAMSLDNPMGLAAPDFETTYTMTRQVLALDFEYVDAILTELADSAVDYFVLGRELAVYDAGADPGWFVQRDGARTRIAATADTYGRYIYGLFTDTAFRIRPGWRLDGMSQSNDVIVPGADSGEAGFRRYWRASDVDLLDGLLTTVDVTPLYRAESDIIVDDAVFQQRATSLLALRNGPVDSISGAPLSETAPVRMENLYPGSLWAIDLGDVGLSGMIDVQRLKSIEVTVTADEGGILEEVVPTLIPLGSDETVNG